MTNQDAGAEHYHFDEVNPGHHEHPPAEDSLPMTTHNLLHVLWTKAVGMPEYNKKEWLELERRIGNKV